MKWLIYPYAPEFIPVVRYNEIIKNGEIALLSAPSGFALQDRDGFVWGTEKSGYQIQDTADTSLYDGIWITPEITYMQDSDIESAFNRLDIKGKTVYYSALLSPTKEDVLFNILKNHKPLQIIHRKQKDINFEWVTGNVINKIQTPIIAVAGIGSSSQKFDIQLYLRKYLLQMGYKVSQIGTKPYCEMLGFHSLPDWMFDNTYTDVEKIYAFNNYVKALELNEKPEVIILGIPEGIMPFNEKHSQGYGIKAFEIFSAVHPDYLLVSLYNGKYNQDFFDEIRNLARYRFHAEIDKFYVSNYAPVSTSYKREQLQFTFSMENADNEENFSFLNFSDSKMANEIVDKLSVYDEYAVI
ncbi:MAG: TIGR04066 family peptide maturation system protein [Lachnospiraceae bacterium]|nr:TIGR04066 family peptide maturation system protein [Lachnospiraceae bacterium]